MTIAVLCFFANVYFSVRFSKRPTFSPNLRLILVTAHMCKAVVSLLHPVIQIVPQSWYSVTDGSPVSVFIYYFIWFIIHSCIFFTATEYGLVVLEQKEAVKTFTTYETQGTATARRLLLFSIGPVTLLSLLKGFCFIVFDPSVPLQERLERAFIIERCPGALIFLHMFGGSIWFYGLLETIKLHKLHRKNFYQTETLSGSYTIKQSRNVIHVLLSITVAFAVMFLVSFIGMVVAFYGRYFLGQSLTSPMFRAANNFEYVGLALYNLFSVLFMLFHFKPMRRLMLSDVNRYLLLKVRVVPVDPKPINWQMERTMHFEYLKRMW
ncbi:hypothetical protein M3Y95_00295500 [Aphelenchoides besseyi]|nr:hypothetical protein M3Y95_00295500 [Aphelenchoides besseyi]